MFIKRNIIFSLENRKKDGIPVIENVPIRMRVIYKGQRVDFFTGFRVDAAKWDETKQKVKLGSINKLKQTASDINSSLSEYENDIQTIFKEYELRGTPPSPLELRNAFKEKRDTSVKTDNERQIFFASFEQYTRETSIKNNWEESTARTIATAKSHLFKFDSDITFDSLTESRLMDYVNYLLSQDLKNRYVNKQIDYLKRFLRWATVKGYNKNLTFEAFKPKLKTVQKKVIFLTVEELTQLQEYKIPTNKGYLERVRDVFLFCCYTGLRHSDVYNLKRSDIKPNHIEVTTRKTADNIRIDLNVHSRAILNKYKDFQFDKGKVLPVISNQKANDYLKELAELAGLNEQITDTYYKGGERIDEVAPKYTLIGTHVARRTFICYALSIGIPAEVIMKWTGHSDYKAMKPYIDVADSIKAREMAKFNSK